MEEEDQTHTQPKEKQNLLDNEQEDEMLHEEFPQQNELQQEEFNNFLQKVAKYWNHIPENMRMQLVQQVKHINPTNLDAPLNSSPLPSSTTTTTSTSTSNLSFISSSPPPSQEKLNSTPTSTPEKSTSTSTSTSSAKYQPNFSSISENPSTHVPLVTNNTFQQQRQPLSHLHIYPRKIDFGRFAQPQPQPQSQSQLQSQPPLQTQRQSQPRLQPLSQPQTHYPWMHSPIHDPRGVQVNVLPQQIPFANLPTFSGRSDEDVDLWLENLQLIGDLRLVKQDHMFRSAVFVKRTSGKMGHDPTA